MPKFETGKTYTFCSGTDYYHVTKRTRCYVTIRTRSGEHRERIVDLDGDGCERAKHGVAYISPEHELHIEWTDEAEAELAYYLRYRYIGYTPDPKVVQSIRDRAFELAFDSGESRITARDVTDAIKLAA